VDIFDYVTPLARASRRVSKNWRGHFINVLCTYLSLHAHCHCNVCIAACVANKLLH